MLALNLNNSNDNDSEKLMEKLMVTEPNQALQSASVDTAQISSKFNCS